jgi:chromosome segregation ATPase
MAENKESTHNSEGSPWFWKIFGGAIMGSISVLLLSHITNINNNIDRTFISLKSENKELFNMINAQKEKIISLEQIKEKINNFEILLNQIQFSINENKQKIITNEAQSNSIKEEIKDLKEFKKDALQQIREIRDKFVAEEATKKAISDNAENKIKN